MFKDNKFYIEIATEKCNGNQTIHVVCFPFPVLYLTFLCMICGLWDWNAIIIIEIIEIYYHKLLNLWNLKVITY